MTFPHKNFLGMSENAMLTILAKQNTPKPTIKQIVESVRNEKKRLRSEGARRTQYKRLWSELLEPLEYEIRLVERMNTYRGAVERDAAGLGQNVVQIHVAQIKAVHRRRHARGDRKVR